MKTNLNKQFFIFIFLLSSAIAQDLSALEIMGRVLGSPKPKSSITDIKLEIVRVKRGKEKVKVREFTRYQKNYDTGKENSGLVHT